MSTHENIPTSYHHYYLIECNLISSSYIWKIAHHLVLNNNHSLTLLQCIFLLMLIDNCLLRWNLKKCVLLKNYIRWFFNGYTCSCKFIRLPVVEFLFWKFVQGTCLHESKFWKDLLLKGISRTTQRGLGYKESGYCRKDLEGSTLEGQREGVLEKRFPLKRYKCRLPHVQG